MHQIRFRLGFPTRLRLESSRRSPYSIPSCILGGGGKGRKRKREGKRRKGKERKGKGGEGQDPLDLLPRKNFLATPVV